MSMFFSYLPVSIYFVLFTVVAVQQKVEFFLAIIGLFVSDLLSFSFHEGVRQIVPNLTQGNPKCNELTMVKSLEKSAVHINFSKPYMKNEYTIFRTTKEVDLKQYATSITVEKFSEAPTNDIDVIQVSNTGA